MRLELWNIQRNENAAFLNTKLATLCTYHRNPFRNCTFHNQCMNHVGEMRGLVNMFLRTPKFIAPATSTFQDGEKKPEKKALLCQLVTINGHYF